jgi:hypothetical protein
MMRPLNDALRSVVIAGDYSWADTTRAASIAAEGRRLSHICSAIGIVPRSSETASLLVQLTTAVKARHDVLFNAVELLRTPDASFEAIDSERDDTTVDILGFGSTLEEFATASGVAASAGSKEYKIANPLLALSFPVLPSWVPIRSGIDVFVIAPANIQRYSVSGLGPDGWKQGTSTRVRRFRNETGRTLEEAVNALDSLLFRFGNRIDETSSVIGSEPGALLTFSSPDGSWRTLVGATVVSDATYLFEIGCPSEFIFECESALSDLLTGVTFDAG